MKHTVQLMCLVLVLALAFCSADPTTFRIKTIYTLEKRWYGEDENSSVIIDTLYYTKDGRRDYSGRGISLKEVSNGNIVVRTAYNKAGETVNIVKLYFNEMGLEDSVETGTVEKGISTTKYIYNKQGKVVEERHYSPNRHVEIHKYVLVDGNRVEDVISSVPSLDTIRVKDSETGQMVDKVIEQPDIIVRNEYFSDKVNFPTVINYGTKRQDVSSKNLEKKSVSLTMWGDTIDVDLFHYTFDSKGRVVSVVKTAERSKSYDSTAYTYY